MKMREIDNTPSAQTAIKTAILHDRQISVDDLIGLLRAIGYKPTRYAVATFRTSFRQDLAVMVEAGIVIPDDLPSPSWLKRARRDVRKGTGIEKRNSGGKRKRAIVRIPVEPTGKRWKPWHFNG